MRCSITLIAAVLAATWLSSAASAQENLEKGKSGAQIFATDCAICHKTPQAVVKGGAPGEGFLLQHYTSGRETAASVAAYLRGIKPPASVERAARTKSTRPAAKGGPKAAGEKTKKTNEAKPAEPKPAAVEAKPAEPADARATQPKAPEQKEPPAEKKE